MSQNKDLQKTKLCTYHLQGKCGLGTSCKFAHDASEVRKAPNLTKTRLCPKFMAGNCFNENCTFAHGEAELVATPSFKKKICVWHQQGKCRNGAKCGFVHDVSELRGGEAFVDKVPAAAIKKNLEKMAPPKEIDDDASTCAPSSSWALAESDATLSQTNVKGVESVTSHPQENLYRMMAGRGAAPLEQQVATMGLALAELQTKLNQVENHMLRTQVGQMQHTISQLSEQCAGVEDHLRQQPKVLPKTLPCETPHFNADAPTCMPADKTDLHGVAKQTGGKRPKATHQTRAPKQTATSVRHQEWWQRPEVRLALGAVVIAFWLALEFGQNR